MIMKQLLLTAFLSLVLLPTYSQSILFRKYYEDERLFMKGYELCYDSLQYKRAIDYLVPITSISRRSLACSTIAYCYNQLGDRTTATSYLIESLQTGFPYNEDDTLLLNKEKAMKYFSSKIDSNLIRKINEVYKTDQKYRGANHKGNRIESKKLSQLQELEDFSNLSKFKKIVREHGWPIVEKTGDDIRMKGFNAFIDHFPPKEQRQYLDSCLFYAKQNREDWRRAMTFINDLLTDDRPAFVPSLFMTTEAHELNDLEFLEIASLYELSLRYSDSRFRLIIGYNVNHKAINKVNMIIQALKKIGYKGMIQIKRMNKNTSGNHLIYYSLAYEK
jgi:hypothetical protein